MIRRFHYCCIYLRCDLCLSEVFLSVLSVLTALRSKQRLDATRRSVWGQCRVKSGVLTSLCRCWFLSASIPMSPKILQVIGMSVRASVFLGFFFGKWLDVGGLYKLHLLQLCIIASRWHGVFVFAENVTLDCDKKRTKSRQSLNISTISRKDWQNLVSSWEIGTSAHSVLNFRGMFCYSGFGSQNKLLWGVICFDNSFIENSCNFREWQVKKNHIQMYKFSDT